MQKASPKAESSGRKQNGKSNNKQTSTIAKNHKTRSAKKQKAIGAEKTKKNKKR